MNEELRKKSERSVRKLKEFSNKDYIFQNSVRQIKKYYQNIAWDNWINQHDVNSFKNEISNSILTLVRSNEYFKNLGLYMSMPRVPLCELALSDNQELMSLFSSQDYEVRLSQTKFQLFSEIVKSGGDQIYSALFLSAMKRDMTQLSKLLNIIDSPKSKKLYFEYELPFFRGLLSGNKDLIIKTINEISSPRSHKRTNSYNGVFKDITSFPAIGYAKIAWINEHQIELSNKYIDNELLPVSSNLKYGNDIDSVIDEMTLDSEYQFHNGVKKRVRNDFYDVFVYSTDDLSGKTCIVEDLIPNVYETESNFIGLKTGNKFNYGYLIGTRRKSDSKSLLEKINKVKRVDLIKRKKTLQILQKYLDEIDEISKTKRGGKILMDNNFSLKHQPIIEKSKTKTLRKLSVKKKNALIELGKYCFDEVSYKKYVAEINSLKNYDNHEDYGSTLNYLSSKLQDEGMLQFFSLDWKTEISELDSKIEQSIRINFDLKIELDVSSKYSNQSSISTEGCFTQFMEDLMPYGMEMKILDAGGDSHVFLLHSAESSPMVLKLLKDIKFEQIKNGL